MPSSIGLAATRQLVATALATSSARPVVLRKFAVLPVNGSRFTFKLVRTYAAAAATGTKSTTAAKGAKKTSATAKKPAAKKTVTAAKKTTKAKAKPKPKPKAKAKARAKPKAAKAKGRKAAARKPSQETLLTRQRQELKRTAQFSEPKTLAEQPWTLFIAEQTRGKETSIDDARTRLNKLAEAYKALPEAQLRRLQTTAEQNKASNTAAYKQWVESFTPEQIAAAIHARKVLKSKFSFPKGNMKTIQDGRQPKRPLTAYVLFTKSKWESGDIANTKDAVGSIKLLSQEWKNLSPEARQPFLELAKADMDRYEKDVNSVLNREVVRREAN